jgi:hypothetical protein
MKRLKFANKNNKRIMLTLTLALVLLVTATMTGTSSLQFIKPAMAKKLTTTADIADDAVTSPKIEDGEVKTSDIADGTITDDDVSPAFIIRKTLNDDIAGHSHGWNPDSDDDLFGIRDNDVSPTKFVHLIKGGDSSDCQITNVFSGQFNLECSLSARLPPEGTPLRYVIINPAEQVVTSSTFASSSSSPTISSPFNSLGNP